MAKYLSQAGIRYVFGYPGDPNLEFMEATRQEGMTFVLARREGTAAFMADAYGQLTGLPEHASGADLHASERGP
jgi:acetolactate synthase-1/2/3 large subunit